MGSTRDSLKKHMQIQAENNKPIASAFDRMGRKGNAHTIPPEKRTLPPGPQQLAQVDSAYHHASAAEASATMHERSQALIESDPRHERDQKVFELGKQGKLPLVPPTEAEKITLAARTGVPAEAASQIPSTPQEQVEQDMPRLEAAEAAAAERSAVIERGASDNAPKNNFTDAVTFGGKQAGGAEGRAQTDSAQAKASVNDQDKNIIR